ncbi:unnamed protein product [Cyclocybe aegerita]|uniref:Uncharacterized protein n=1 Tax=Cyclocybe aegerita TaxID=1973307 RepID=A0A8S0XJA6_CYCAE|nr:unnamed protein product [Cyclocybe aegerita]
MVPVTPDATRRYEPKAAPDVVNKKPIPRLTRTFQSEMPSTGHGWSLFRHPEGACYFYHKGKNVFTDSDVNNTGIREEITAALDSIERYVRNQHILLPEGAPLVIDLDLQLDSEEPESIFYYYYVDHEAKAIFFLHPFDTSSLPAFEEAPRSTTELHRGNEIEAQYWYFVQLFPTSTKLSEEFLSKLADTCIYWLADVSTSPTSTTPYTPRAMSEILQLVGPMEKMKNSICPGSMAALARHMYMFAHTRFIHYHGEPHARLDRTATVHCTMLYQRTWLIRIISPFLFFGPDFHLRLLQDAWVDKIIHADVWVKITAKMQKEWIGLIAYSALMLACGVSFLTIPGVVPDGGDGPGRTMSQIVRLFSYLSTISSFTSTILGCLLHRHHQTSVSDAAPEAQQYLNDQENKYVGLELLAIQHSLPHAFLMWSVIFFLAAFSAFCFSSKEIASITAVAL